MGMRASVAVGDGRKGSCWYIVVKVDKVVKIAAMRLEEKLRKASLAF